MSNVATRIPVEEVKRLEAMVDRERYPATFDYLLLHGLTAAISRHNITGNFETPEDVYRECLKRRIRWEQLIEPPPEGVLLV
ncbi:MAG: hypothetical protein DDT33_00512 [Firmicutes bacterium]|nr:hypothetical protein [Bacillota bacterium]